MIVTADGVRELARRGQLARAGWYKHWPLYDGRAIEAFADPATAEDASRAGELCTADGAAAYLGIRRTDFDHLTRAGLLERAGWCPGTWDRRGRCSVPLYRTGDLDALLTDPAIPWERVRATPPWHRSPLAQLLTARAQPGRRRPAT